MARKKNPAAAQNQDEIRSQTKLESAKQPPSPPLAAAAEDKIRILKTLNDLLVRQTTELREEVSHLNSLVDDSFLSFLECDINSLVLSCGLADERLRLEQREAAVARRMEADLSSMAADKAEAEGTARSLQARVDSVLGALRSTEERLESVMADKDQIKKALDRAVSDSDKNLLDLDLKGKMVEYLEREMKEREDSLRSLLLERAGYQELVEDLERQKEESIRSKKEEIDLLISAREDDAAKTSAMEEELRRLLLSKDRLEAELGGSREAFDLLKKKEEILHSEVIESEERNAKVLEELKRLRFDLDALKKEKDKGERSFESQMKESTQELGDLRGKMREIARNKDETERARAELELQIVESQKEVEQLQSIVSKLEGVCKDVAEERDATQKDLSIERGEAEGLRLLVGELKKSNNTVQEELKRLQVEFALLKEGKEVGEKCFDSQLGEYRRQLDDLRGRMGEIAGQKEEIEHVRAQQELEIAGLQKMVEQLHSAASEQEGVCRDLAEANAELRADRDAAQRDLVAEREEASRLREQVGELEKAKDGITEELGQLKAEHGGLVAESKESKGHLSLLTEEISSIERSLTATQCELEDMNRKMKAAEMNSERALSLLRSTAFTLAVGDGQENGAARELGHLAGMDEMLPFATELETISKAFMSRVRKLEDLSREVGLLQGAVVEAQKKKSGLLIWLAPIMSTVLAVGFGAYMLPRRTEGFHLNSSFESF